MRVSTALPEGELVCLPVAIYFHCASVPLVKHDGSSSYKSALDGWDCPGVRHFRAFSGFEFSCSQVECTEITLQIVLMVMKNCMKIRLEPVTAKNWKACIALELAPDQQHFLPANLYSIAEAQFYEAARSLAIYNAEHQIVGYVLFGKDVFTTKWKIFRLMIDKSHQGKGYGESAMREIIAWITHESDGNEILICYQNTNQAARRLYAKLGFVEQEIDSTGKVTASLKLNMAYPTHLK